MLKYIIKKIIFTCIVLVGAATCAFLLLHAIPGDTAEALAGPQATVEDVDNLRRAMELDQPLGKQYISYMGNLLHGDLGYSYRTNKPVMDILKSAWPATLQLAVCSMIVAVLLGVPIGIFAAIHRGKGRRYHCHDSCLFRSVHALFLAGTVADHRVFSQS